MKKPQPPTPDTASLEDAPAPLPQWEDGSGEGAASALESLRKLEQTRRSGRPADDRPGAE